MASRESALPRSFWLLLALLGAAVAALVVSQALQRGAPEAGAEARLLPGLDAARVTALALARDGGELVLRRGEGGWRFAAGFADRADSAAAAALVRDLCEAPALPLLPDGGEGDDGASLGLEGPRALRLRLEVAGGPPAQVVLGLPNPVRELCYARVEGRAGVWGVSPRLRERFEALPDAARLRRLWPRFAPTDVETMARRAGAGPADLFARDAQGRWWLRAPVGGAAVAGAPFAAYSARYADRVVRRDGADWWRACDRAVDELLFKVGEVPVSSFGRRDAPPETLRAAGLAPPVASLHAVLRGGQTFAAACGGDALTGHVFALRDGLPHLLRVGGAFAEPLATPVSGLVNADAVDFALALADSIRLQRGDRPPVRAHREGKIWHVAGRPNGPIRPTPGDLVSDLCLTIDRLPFLAVLPPAARREEALAPANRFVLSVWGPGGPAAGRTVEFAPLAPGPGREPAVAAAAVAGAWFPQDGRLLGVDRELLVTLRNLFLVLEAPAR